MLDQRGLADAQAVGRLPPSEQRHVVHAILRRELGVMTLACWVITFLALLEMFKQGLVDLDQATSFGELTVSWLGPASGGSEPVIDLVEEYQG